MCSMLNPSLVLGLLDCLVAVGPKATQKAGWEGAVVPVSDPIL